MSGLVQLDPTSADLLLGMGGSVSVIAAQAQNAVLVPLTALHVDSAGKYSVLVMRNGELVTQDVRVGLKDLVNADGGEVYGNYGFYEQRTEDIMRRLVGELGEWVRATGVTR